MGKRLFFQIYPAFLLLIAVTIIPTAWFATGIFREFHIDSIREGVLHRAAILQPILLEKINTPGFLKFCDRTAAASGARLTVIDAKGKVLYDSSSDYAHMPNHEERPELKNALDEHKPAVSMRYSSTLMKDMLYVAEPLIDDAGNAVGAFRLSLPLAAVDTSIGALKLKLFGFALVLALAAMGIGLLISRRLSRPLEEVRRSVVRMADGDLDRHLSETGSIEEINALAASVNSLAVQLKLRIADITSRKNELSTILASMSEGVIAVDPDLRMIIVNRSALEILNLKMDSIEGRTLYEVLRNHKMQTFVENLLAGNAPAEDEIEWDAEEKRRLVLRGSIMTDPDSDLPSGAVVVIRDVTRMRKLEEMRRDFVANVSHEIKTPVTAIKTAVETLSAE
ncbi:MAG: PAS domain-containing protein, partial [bacterium]|nr:PAS domain-containing protein [bacterium]